MQDDRKLRVLPALNSSPIYKLGTHHHFSAAVTKCSNSVSQEVPVPLWCLWCAAQDGPPAGGSVIADCPHLFEYSQKFTWNVTVTKLPVVFLLMLYICQQGNKPMVKGIFQLNFVKWKDAKSVLGPMQLWSWALVQVRLVCSKLPLEGVLSSLVLPRADSLLPAQSSHQGFCESFPVMSLSLCLLETRSSASLVCSDAVNGTN